MADFGKPPVIPSQFQQYNSTVTDPKWAIKFSLVWASVIAIAILASLPRLFHAARIQKAFVGMFGVSENGKPEVVDRDLFHGKAGCCEDGPDEIPPFHHENFIGELRNYSQRIYKILYWSFPGLELNVGQIFLVATYFSVLVVCMVVDAPLTLNSNRPGFIALAQFPVVFLFATKNSILSLLLGPGRGYEKLNFIHRWSGRGMFIGAIVHGALWIHNHLTYDIEILGQQKETSGIAAMSMLSIIVLTSLRPVRKWCFELFFLLHVISFPAFFVTLCYHTPYVEPWIYAPLCLFSLDLLLRLLRMRIKVAFLDPVQDQMTIIRIPYCDDGWLAGQHVRLRVFFQGRIFESHPFTILSASPNISCISRPGITLGARTNGDWTRALNTYAMQQRKRLLDHLKASENEKIEENNIEVPVQVMIDGPYGGSSLDLGQYETVLLFAGGSGVTFSIGLLDDIVGRCVRSKRKNGERTRRIQLAWSVRSFGSIKWFAPMLIDIANTASNSSTLDVYISVYVTCLCNPEAIPDIPNCNVTLLRPSVYHLLHDLTTPPSSGKNSSRSPPAEDAPQNHSQNHKITDNNLSAAAKFSVSELGEVIEVNEAAEPHRSGDKLQWVGLGGGLAVCASGPEDLTREASNAVARLGMTRGAELGEIGLHTESFSL